MFLLPTTTVTDDAAVRPNIKHQQATAISSYPSKVRVFSGGDNKIETPYETDMSKYKIRKYVYLPQSV
jgi:hypothetical protein